MKAFEKVLKDKKFVEENQKTERFYTLNNGMILTPFAQSRRNSRDFRSFSGDFWELSALSTYKSVAI